MASPVFYQLRQMIDHLIVAAFMRKQDWYAKADWRAELLRNPSTFPIDRFSTPRQAPSVVNVFWKQRRMLAPAGGGVSIVADKALENATRDETLADKRVAIQPIGDHWWWD